MCVFLSWVGESVGSLNQTKAHTKNAPPPPQAGKKGLHAGADSAPPPARVTDLSLDARKARSYLPHLQREADVRAVVDYVFSGSRFKVGGVAVGGWRWWLLLLRSIGADAHIHTQSPHKHNHPPPPPHTKNKKKSSSSPRRTAPS